MTAASHLRATKGEIKRFAKLRQKKHRDAERCFLAEGLRTVTELLANLPDEEHLVALFVVPEQLHNFSLKEPFRNKVFLIDPEEVHRLSGTSTAQGIVGIFRQQNNPEIETLLSGRKEKTFVLALDDVQDPGNVGTIVRTAAWFGVTAVLCGPGTADRYNAKAVRAGAGSIYCLNHYGVSDFSAELEKIKSLGYSVFCSSLQGKDMREHEKMPEKKVLVIGNEAHGISQPVLLLADHLITIPRGEKTQGIQSLNAAVSTAVLLAKMAL